MMNTSGYVYVPGWSKPVDWRGIKISVASTLPADEYLMVWKTLEGVRYKRVKMTEENDT